jgi:hypothetical protein
MAKSKRPRQSKSSRRKRTKTLNPCHSQDTMAAYSREALRQALARGASKTTIATLRKRYEAALAEQRVCHDRYGIA